MAHKTRKQEKLRSDLAIRRRPVSLQTMERSGVIGFMLVALIFVIGLSNDIGRLSGDGFSVR